MQNIFNQANSGWTDEARNYDQKLAQVRLCGQKFTQIKMIRYHLEVHSSETQSFAATVTLGVLAVGLPLFVLLSHIGILPGGLHLSWVLLLLMIGGYILVWRLSAKHAIYLNELCDRLAEYDPVDKERYRQLQQQLKNNIFLRGQVLRGWLQDEDDAIYLVLDRPVLAPECKSALALGDMTSR